MLIYVLFAGVSALAARLLAVKCTACYLEVLLAISGGATLALCLFFTRSLARRVEFGMQVSTMGAVFATAATIEWPTGLHDVIGYALLTTLEHVLFWFAATLLWLAVAGCILSPLRRFIEPGECPACGYDLRGLMNSRCPECGASAARSDVAGK